jgi:hypothetical protein
MEARLTTLARRLLIGVALAATAFGAIGGRAQAFDPQPDPPQARYEFGTWGIAAGQTLRLSLANVAGPSAARRTCVADLDFVDAFGRPVVAAQQVAPLPGHTAFFDLSSEGLVGERQPRLEVRARARLRPSSETDKGRSHAIPELPPGPCLPSVQIIDNATGRTTFAQAPVLVQAGGD